MVPPDNGDSTKDFLDQIDEVLTRNGQKPLEVVTPDARELFLKIRTAYERIFQSMTEETPHRLQAMVCAIESEVEGVQFVGNDSIGFFVIPGVTGNHTLKIAYIDWEKGALKEGFSSTLADVWKIPKVETGFVWADSTSGAQMHFPEHGFHTSGPDFVYGIPNGLEDYEKTGMPQVYFGPCWETTAPPPSS